MPVGSASQSVSVAEAHHARRGRVRGTARRGHPDVVALRLRRRAATWILGDEEITRLAQRDVVGHVEVRGRVETDSHVIVDERRRMLAAAPWLVQIDRYHAIVRWPAPAGDRDVEGVGTIAAVTARRRDLDVLGTIVACRAGGESRRVRVDLYRGAIEGDPLGLARADERPPWLAESAHSGSDGWLDRRARGNDCRECPDRGGSKKAAMHQLLLMSGARMLMARGDDRMTRVSRASRERVTGVVVDRRYGAPASVRAQATAACPTFAPNASPASMSKR